MRRLDLRRDLRTYMGWVRIKAALDRAPKSYQHVSSINMI